MFFPTEAFNFRFYLLFLTAHGSLVATHHFINSSSLILHGTLNVHLSRVMRKPTFCICENEGADQLRGNHEADQRLWFRYTDSSIPLLP